MDDTGGRTEDHWRELIDSFVESRIDGPLFEQQFLTAFRAEVDAGTSIRFAVDQLFYEVDAYCADPSLRGAEDIDENELKAQALQCLLAWDTPWPKI